jgi:predicted metal-dependent peptidase
MTRRENREPLVWNFATDYAINQILIDMNNTSSFRMPQGALLDSSYKGKCAEQIYEKLKNELDKLQKRQNQNGGSGNGRFDEHFDYGGDKTKNNKDKRGKGTCNCNKEELKKYWKNAMRQARILSKGDLPGDLSKLISEFLEPQLNWKLLLNDYLVRSFDRMRWNPPNKKHLHRNIILPSVRSENLFDVICCGIDVSGSISDSDIKDFMTEIKSILDSGLITKMYVLIFDTQVHEVYEFMRGDTFKEITVTGRGGTDFRDVFKRIELEDWQPKCLIMFTDAQGDFPKEQIYNFDTIWIVMGETPVPFGKRIKFRRKGE